MNEVTISRPFGLGCSVNKLAADRAPRRLHIAVEPECLRGQTAVTSPVVPCLLSQQKQPRESDCFPFSFFSAPIAEYAGEG